MRKSNNYYKFMEYVSYGKRCDDTICKDNGVLECTSYCTVSDIEYYENTTLGVENDWLTIKNVLVNEEVICVYYVKGESTFYIDTFILDNFKTQKELKYAIHKAVDKFFINNVDIITETSEIEDYNEYEEILDSTETETGEETTNTTGEGKNNELKGHLYIDTDSVIIAPLPEKKVSESYRKHLHAIMNPEWHHVSLATLSNIDINMLDEKRQRYFKIYQELIKTIQDLHKCKTAATYEIRWWKFKQAITDDILYRETTLYMTRYLDLKISMCNVECGLWTSSDEKATGFKKSRRYGHATLKQ